MPKGYLPYPYHTLPKKQAFQSFPLHFNSPVPPAYLPKSRPIEGGFTTVYQRFIEEISTGTISELEDLTEFRLYRRLQTEVEAVKKAGCSFQLVNPSAAKTARMMHSLKLFNYCPYHSLNLPGNGFTLSHDDNGIPIVRVERKGRRPLTKESVQLAIGLKLKEANRDETHPAREHIPVLASLLGEDVVGLVVADVCVASACKLAIRDQAGRVVDGTTDASKELHCFRMQRLFFTNEFDANKGSLREDVLLWAKKQFSQMDMQWVVTDIDHCIGGPKEVDMVFGAREGQE